MKYAGKELSEMLDLELVQHYQNCLAAEDKRTTASQDRKFTRTDGKAMEFPPVNPEFLNIKSALEAEMKNRNIALYKD